MKIPPEAMLLVNFIMPFIFSSSEKEWNLMLLPTSLKLYKSLTISIYEQNEHWAVKLKYFVFLAIFSKNLFIAYISINIVHDVQFIYFLSAPAHAKCEKCNFVVA